MSGVRIHPTTVHFLYRWKHLLSQLAVVVVQVVVHQTTDERSQVWFPLPVGSGLFSLLFLFSLHSFNQWCVLNQVPRGGTTQLVFTFKENEKLSSAGEASLIRTEWAKKYFGPVNLFRSSLSRTKHPNGGSSRWKINQYFTKDKQKQVLQKSYQGLTFEVRRDLFTFFVWTRCRWIRWQWPKYQLFQISFKLSRFKYLYLYGTLVHFIFHL